MRLIVMLLSFMVSTQIWAGDLAKPTALLNKSDFG